MTETIAIDAGGHARSAFLDRFAACLVILGVLTAAVVTLLSETPIPIERPWLLAVASLFLFAPAQGPSARVLRKVVGLYLVSVLFNLAYPQYVAVTIASTHVAISKSIGPLLLCAIGRMLLNEPSESTRCDHAGLLMAWIAGFAVVIGHMIVLAMMLRFFYGYGYQGDLHVLGHLGLYFVLFLILWPLLDRCAIRRVTGFILLASYLILSLTG
jgi:hypothetical protein